MFRRMILAGLVLACVTLGLGGMRPAHALTYINSVTGEEWDSAGNRFFYVVYYRSPYNPNVFHSLVCRSRADAAYQSEVVKFRGSKTVLVRRVKVGGAERVAVNARPEGSCAGRCSGTMGH